MANYVDLIDRVIKDFDDIFKVLVDKKVKLNDTTVLTSDMMAMETNSISTDMYAGLVDKLVYIEGKGALDTVDIIANSTATSTIAASATAGKYNVTLTALADNGYYDNAAIITSTINVEDLDITSFTSAKLVNVPGEGDTTIPTYVVTPTSGKLISSITLEKGHAHFSFGEDAFADDQTLTIDKTNAITNASSLAISMDSNSYGANNAYSFSFKPSVTHGGTLTVTPTVDKKLGLFTENSDITHDATGTYTFTGTSALDSTTFYIKKGSAVLSDNASNEGNATIIASSNLTFLTPDENGKVTVGGTLVDVASAGYSLEAAVDNINLDGEFSEGYVKGGEKLQLGSIKVNSQTKYLKKGTVNNYTNSAVPIYATLGGLSAVTTTEPTTAEAGNYHTITVGLGASSSTPQVAVKGSIDNGYVTATQYDVTLSGSKDIYIKKGSYSIDPTIAATASSTGMTLSTTDNGGYKLTVTPSLTLGTGTLTAGYISEAGQIQIDAPAANEGAKDYWISAGTVTVSQAVRAVYHEIDTDGKGQATTGSGESIKPVDIFLNAAPEGRDYYTINPIVSATATAGYIPGVSAVSGIVTPDSSTDVIANVTKYLPKADLKWQVAEDGSTSYLEVLQGGYLPSGLISEIDADSAPTMATVKLAIDDDNSSSIFSQSPIAGGYKLTLAKGAVTAGYISSKAGEGALDDEEFYIEKGTLGMTTATGDFGKTITRVTEVVGEGTAQKEVTKEYTLTVTGDVTSTLNFTQGYIETKDVSLNDATYVAETNDKLVTDVTYTTTINKATIGVAEGTSKISLSINTDAIETTEETNAFVITPVLSGSSKITVETKSEGYLSTADSTEIEIVSDANTLSPDPIYIKAGTGGDIEVSDASALGITATPNFTATVAEGTNAGKYAVTVGGTIAPSISLDTGYYGENEDDGSHKISNNITIAGATAYIDKAAAASEIAVTTAVVGTGIEFIPAGTTVAAGQYVEITATAPTVENDVVISTEGYIKDGEVTAATLENNKLTVTEGSKKIYLLSASECTKTIGGTDETIAVTDPITIATEHKYVNQNITVSLSEHAMGSGVVNKLLALEARLAGKPAATTT